MNFAVIRNGRLLATTTPAEAKATIADTMFEGVVGRHDLDAFAATFQVAQAYLVEGVHRVRVYSPDREVPTHFSDIDAPVRAVANSVYALSPTFAMSGFFVYPFFAALMAGLSVMRDDEAGHPLRRQQLTSKEPGLERRYIVNAGEHRTLGPRRDRHFRGHVFDRARADDVGKGVRQPGRRPGPTIGEIRTLESEWRTNDKLRIVLTGSKGSGGTRVGCVDTRVPVRYCGLRDRRSSDALLGDALLGRDLSDRSCGHSPTGPTFESDGRAASRHS